MKKLTSIIIGLALSIGLFAQTDSTRYVMHNGSVVFHEGQRVHFMEEVSSNMITNGTFDDETGWTDGGQWSIGSGVATYTTGAYSNLPQTDADMVSSIEGSTTYDLEFDITSTGNAYIRFRSTDMIQYVAFTEYADGHHEIQFTAPSDVGDAGFDMYCSPSTGTTFSIDNIVLTPQ